MTDLEAVQKRSSRRSYTGGLTTAQIIRLQDLIVKANEESGLGIRLLEQGETIFGSIRNTYGMFSGVQSMFILAGNMQEENLLEKCGYYGQRLVLEATKMGLGTCWVAGTYDRVALEKVLPQGHKLVAVIPIGEISNEKAFIEKFIRTATHRRNKTKEEMANAPMQAPDWFWRGVTAALLAPSALHKQPAKFYWNPKGVTAWVDKETEIQLVDLGIAKLHFEIGAGGKFAEGNGALFVKAESEK